jgi:hypothetical protein
MFVLSIKTIIPKLISANAQVKDPFIMVDSVHSAMRINTMSILLEDV